jgi:predicted CXXCH cytochrome family protein
MLMRYFIYCSLTLLLVFCIGIEGIFSQNNDVQEEIVNPHWTGKDCIECHLEEHPEEKGAPLQFGGDSIKLCNRCHLTEFARTDIHPVGVPLLDAMKQNMPKTFPLENGKVGCLTCHDPFPPMKEDFARQKVDPTFLRGGPYEVLVKFCFYCHRQEEYKKTNPHEQLDEQGRIDKDRCLFCHESLPDPAKVQAIGEVTFKSELALYCVSCHPEQKSGHPSRADHLVTLPGFLQESIPVQLEATEVELPLDGDRIFCATCHNPHEKGVLQRKEAQAGAGEQNFLRLNGGYDLCIICHNDKKLVERGEQFAQKMDEPYPIKTLQSFHEPFKEDKCKLCHVITPERRGKPRAMLFCFNQDCHKSELLDKEFVHEKTVGENCYLCHLGHASAYEKLLKDNQEPLCRSCHPLLRDTNQRLAAEAAVEEKGDIPDNMNGGDGDVIPEEEPLPLEASEDVEAVSLSEEAPGEEEEETGSMITGVAQDRVNIENYQKSSKEHSIFTEYLNVTPVPEGSECGFCHSPKHKVNIGKMDMENCSKCHMFVNDILSRTSSVPINVHQTFREKVCSVCHDPHAGPYQYLLKEPPETYFEEGVGLFPVNLPPVEPPEGKGEEWENGGQKIIDKEAQPEK